MAITPDMMSLSVLSESATLVGVIWILGISGSAPMTVALCYRGEDNPPPAADGPAGRSKSPPRLIRLPCLQPSSMSPSEIRAEASSTMSMVGKARASSCGNSRSAGRGRVTADWRIPRRMTRHCACKCVCRTRSGAAESLGSAA